MRYDKVKDDLRPLIFDFFFWFSRFESALKENGWLQSKQAGATALTDWRQFVEAYEEDYALSEIGGRLIAENPQKQIMGNNGLTFTDLVFEHDDSQLKRVTLLLRTVRNNLFHGGKSGSHYWDDPARIQVLLPLCLTILNELAEFGDLKADYTGYY
jgi:hypothetical protein